MVMKERWVGYEPQMVLFCWMIKAWHHRCFHSCCGLTCTDVEMSRCGASARIQHNILWESKTKNGCFYYQWGASPSWGDVWLTEGALNARVNFKTQCCRPQQSSQDKKCVWKGGRKGLSEWGINFSLMPEMISIYTSLVWIRASRIWK